MCNDKINSISEILNRREIVKIAGDRTNIYAAVMMVIKKSGDCLSTLLIKRSTNDSDVFSGHMAFPGGKKKNEHENKLETAYRETQEEVGINLRNKSIVLGHLDDCKPSTPAAKRFIVRPYVAYLKEDYPLSLNDEVSEAVWIPLIELRNIYLSNLGKYEGQIRKEAFEYNYNEYFIWGMTGRILNNFFDLTCYLFD
jgi:8-oxo-dGTP pyrophosphatase MutT (NUDIX family)